MALPQYILKFWSYPDNSVAASNWLLNWAIAYATPYMVDEKGANLQSKVFFVWGTFCFICIAFVYVKFPFIPLPQLPLTRFLASS